MFSLSTPFPARILPSLSVMMLHEQAAPHAVSSLPSSFADESAHNSMRQLHLRCHLHDLLASSSEEDFVSSSSTMQPADDFQWSALSLAKQALSASKQAAAVAEELRLITIDDDSDSSPLSFAFADSSIGKNEIVRSTRLKERRSKQRKVSSKVLDEERYLKKRSDAQRRSRVEKKLKERLDGNDPLRLFLWSPDTRQILNLEEESQLVAQIQDLFKLERTKIKLQSKFGREPTLHEWADYAGLSCRVLQARLRSGNKSNDKLIHANLRLVVHIAKYYQGRGLSFLDLLQEGSLGLMRSVEKFKPRAGCRFSTYAYWWIRHTIKRGIYMNSKTVRLPESVYILLGKVAEAKKLYRKEGNHNPTKEEIASRVGMTVEKLEMLILSAKSPLSMQRAVWAGQKTTFEDITADPSVEIPEVSVAKELMRCHVRSLLNILNPNERKVIRLRFGLEDGYEKSLSEIGNVLGVCRERVRQIESKGLNKLKKCIVDHQLDAYAQFIVYYQ